MIRRTATALLATLLALPGGAACRSARQALPATPPAAAAAVAATYSNTIRWSTASETDNFGFDVFRAESEEGPFRRLNPRPIEGGGTIDEPRSYHFVDDTIDPRRAYYYYVESISMSGERQRFTPVGRAAPKIPGA